MSTVVVDLPAHNVYPIATSNITVVGGPEALAATDLTSYVEVDGAGFVGGQFAVGATGIGSGGGGALGFGVATLPAGAVFVSAEFVGLGYRTSGHDVTDPFYQGGAGGFYTPPVNTSPALTVFYTGHGSSHEVLSDFPVGSSGADAAESLRPVNRPDWTVPPGPSGTGLNGLCPEFDWDSIDSPETHAIRLFYLAIRVTYTISDVYIPIRLLPRDDALGAAPVPRNFPPDVTSARNFPIIQ